MPNTRRSSQVAAFQDRTEGPPYTLKTNKTSQNAPVHRIESSLESVGLQPRSGIKQFISKRSRRTCHYPPFTDHSGNHPSYHRSESGVTSSHPSNHRTDDCSSMTKQGSLHRGNGRCLNPSNDADAPLRKIANS